MDTKKIIKISLLILTVPTIALAGWVIYKKLYKKEPLFGSREDEESSGAVNPTTGVPYVTGSAEGDATLATKGKGAQVGGVRGAVLAGKGRG